MGTSLLFLAFLAVSVPASEGEATRAPEVGDFRLENGLRAVVVHFPGSTNLSIYSFLPLGLATDGPGRAQWSHLLEHLAIRSTVPYGSPQANGETMADHMRLDFYGTVENWRDGLSHHAKWLEGTPLTEKLLAAEKRHVNTECDNVARMLAAHKFAFAAWAQAVRHGRDHAAIKGDVTRATLAEIERYREQRLAAPDRCLVAIVGGIDPETARPVVAETLGRIRSKAKRVAPGGPSKLAGPAERAGTAEPAAPAERAAPAKSAGPGERAGPPRPRTPGAKVTWDLDARHLIMTWPLPEVTDPDYAALLAASQWLTWRLLMDTEVKELTGMVLAGADLFTPEGNFFYVSASLQREASLEAARGKLEAHVSALRSGEANAAEMQLIGIQMAQSMTVVPDPATMPLPAQPRARAMFEGNIGLRWGMQEFQYGAERPALARRLGAVGHEAIQHAAKTYLTDEKRTVCVIEGVSQERRSSQKR